MSTHQLSPTKQFQNRDAKGLVDWCIAIQTLGNKSENLIGTIRSAVIQDETLQIEISQLTAIEQRRERKTVLKQPDGELIELRLPTEQELKNASILPAYIARPVANMPEELAPLKLPATLVQISYEKSTMYLAERALIHELPEQPVKERQHRERLMAPPQTHEVAFTSQILIGRNAKDLLATLVTPLPAL